MRTHSEYLEELAGVPLFAGCWRRELELIARSVDVVDLDDETVVVEEGRAGHELYVVAWGAATVAREGQLLGMLGPGDWFGEGAALAGARHPATVTVVGPTRVVIIGRRELLALVKTVPGLAPRLLKEMATRLQTESSSGTVAPVAAEEVPDDPGATTEPRRPLRA
jgi:CRP-like cAMP-binding protein